MPGCLCFWNQNAQRIGAEHTWESGSGFGPLLNPSHQGVAVGLTVFSGARLFGSTASPGAWLADQANNHLNIAPARSPWPLRDLMELQLPAFEGARSETSDRHATASGRPD